MTRRRPWYAPLTQVRLRTPGKVAVATLFLAFLMFSIDSQVISPLFPDFARRYGVGLGRIVWITGVFQLSLLLAPVFGPLSDRVGRKPVLLLGLVILALSAQLCATAPHFTALLLGRLAAGLGFALFMPALNGYIADCFSYRRRGTAMGVVRAAWSISGILGIPAAALIVEAAGLSLLFSTICLLTVAIAFVTALSLPPMGSTLRDGRARDGRGHKELVLGRYRPISPRTAVIRAFLGSVFWIAAPSSSFFYLAAWLRTGHGFTTTMVGMVFAVASATALAGTVVGGSISDRLGKSLLAKVWLLVLAASLAGQALAPTLASALICLVVMAFAWEAGLVAFMTLATELAPAKRGTVLSLISCAHGVGSIAFSLLGPMLWAMGGYSLATMAGAAAALMAALLLWPVGRGL